MLTLRYLFIVTYRCECGRSKRTIGRCSVEYGDGGGVVSFSFYFVVIPLFCYANSSFDPIICVYGQIRQMQPKQQINMKTVP